LLGEYHPKNADIDSKHPIYVPPTRTAGASGAHSVKVKLKPNKQFAED